MTREWLETNGLGGFASSTIAGASSRRYHGLLIAATKPPVGRMVLLSKLDETLVTAAERHELATNRYAGTVHPQGFHYLQSFRLDPFPTCTFKAGEHTIAKSVFMVDGENTTVIRYTLLAGPGCTLELRPLIAFRDYHSLTHQNDALNPDLIELAGIATIQPYAALPALHLAHNAGRLDRTGIWYFRFEYEIEKQRGLDFQEDLFNPFVLRFELATNSTAVVIASLEPHKATDADSLCENELRRRENVLASSPINDAFVARLTSAADQYLVRRGDLKTIVAGYHWFTDWGRDTMIALPGLTLATGRYETARQILLAYADAVSQGMLPNRFPDSGEQPEYNTADATLWFFEAIRAFIECTGEIDFVCARLYPVMKSIVEWHRKGTRYGIRAGSDGLLHAGEPGVQLTWMDSKIGDWVVTPRTGKPVEIQALWYNALRIQESLATHAADSEAERQLSALADSAKASFNRQFWNAADGCLYDVIDGSHRDASIRPNQIFAVSLRHGMLSHEREAHVVEVVQRELLTPLGLRTLSPANPAYRPRCKGGVAERDSAYHQGTVWPWLMGPFVSAYLKVHRRSEFAKAQASEWLQPFAAHLTFAGLGQISEIADGEPPHTPRGCIAQAWSVAEILRAALENRRILSSLHREGR
jgi:predicted glycogen debranching enzyme